MLTVLQVLVKSIHHAVCITYLCDTHYNKDLLSSISLLENHNNCLIGNPSATDQSLK